MITVRKNNRQLKIAEKDLQLYKSEGYKVVENVKLYRDNEVIFVAEAVKEKYLKLGFTEKAAEQKPIEPKPIDKMTEAELRAYAAENGIGLDGLTKKADVLAAIVAAEQKQTEGGE